MASGSTPQFGRNRKSRFDFDEMTARQQLADINTNRNLQEAFANHGNVVCVPITHADCHLQSLAYGAETCAADLRGTCGAPPVAVEWRPERDARDGGTYGAGSVSLERRPMEMPPQFTKSRTAVDPRQRGPTSPGRQQSYRTVATRDKFSMKDHAAAKATARQAPSETDDSQGRRPAVASPAATTPAATSPAATEHRATERSRKRNNATGGKTATSSDPRGDSSVATESTANPASSGLGPEAAANAEVPSCGGTLDGTSTEVSTADQSSIFREAGMETNLVHQLKQEVAAMQEASEQAKQLVHSKDQEISELRSLCEAQAKELSVFKTESCADFEVLKQRMRWLERLLEASTSTMPAQAATTGSPTCHTPPPPEMATAGLPTCHMPSPPKAQRDDMLASPSWPTEPPSSPKEAVQLSPPGGAPRSPMPRRREKQWSPKRSEKQWSPKRHESRLDRHEARLDARAESRLDARSEKRLDAPPPLQPRSPLMLDLSAGAPVYPGSRSSASAFHHEQKIGTATLPSSLSSTASHAPLRSSLETACAAANQASSSVRVRSPPGQERVTARPVHAESLPPPVRPQAVATAMAAQRPSSLTGAQRAGSLTMKVLSPGGLSPRTSLRACGGSHVGAPVLETAASLVAALTSSPRPMSPRSLSVPNPGGWSHMSPRTMSVPVLTPPVPGAHVQQLQASTHQLQSPPQSPKLSPGTLQYGPAQHAHACRLLSA